MRAIARIIVHHSASNWGDAAAIRRWHLARPDIGRMGYHYVILNGRRKSDLAYLPEDDGKVEAGCPLEQPGAHAKGNNADSIGICLIGGKLTRWQFVSLMWLIRKLNVRFGIGIDGVLGHCEVDPIRKPECPGFNMELLRAALTVARESLARLKGADDDA